MERTRDVEYLIKAHDKIYATDAVYKFVDEPGRLRALVDSLNRTIKVDFYKAEELSVNFTAVILEMDTKHKLGCSVAPATRRSR